MYVEVGEHRDTLIIRYPVPKLLLPWVGASPTNPPLEKGGAVRGLCPTPTKALLCTPLMKLIFRFTDTSIASTAQLASSLVITIDEYFV